MPLHIDEFRAPLPHQIRQREHQPHRPVVDAAAAPARARRRGRAGHARRVAGAGAAAARCGWRHRTTALPSAANRRAGRCATARRVPPPRWAWRATVGGVVDQRRVGLVPDRGDQRDAEAAAARTTASSLNAIRSSRLPPPRATISTSGRGIGPSAARGEPGDGGGDAGGRALALHRHRPEQDAAREAAQRWWCGCPGSPRRAGWSPRRSPPAARGSARLRAASNRPSAARRWRSSLDARQQRAGAGIVQPLDDQLVFERSP